MNILSKLKVKEMYFVLDPSDMEPEMIQGFNKLGRERVMNILDKLRN